MQQFSVNHSQSWNMEVDRWSSRNKL